MKHTERHKVCTDLRLDGHQSVEIFVDSSGGLWQLSLHCLLQSSSGWVQVVMIRQGEATLTVPDCFLPSLPSGQESREMGVLHVQLEWMRNTGGLDDD